MKVLHAAETITGGVATVLSDIARHHAKPIGLNRIAFLVPASQRMDLTSAIPVSTFKRTGRNLPSFIAFASALQYQIERTQPDIVVLHSTFAGVIGRVLLAFRRNRPKIVYCPHGWSFTREGRTIVTALYALIERVLSRLTDAIINISHDEHSAAIARGLPPRLMRVIHNGTENNTRLSPLPGKASRSGPVNLLFVGRFDRQKGLDRLLPIIGLLGSKVHLTIIGQPVLKDGPSLLFPPNSSQVGWVKHDKLFPHYRAADALIVPSRWEGFGLIATEAMQAGTAVIAANVGGLKDIVQHGKTGYLFKSPEQLQKLLDNLDRKSLTRMGLAGRQRYLKHFTSQRMANELLALFKSLL